LLPLLEPRLYLLGLLTFAQKKLLLLGMPSSTFFKEAVMPQR
jgi:hypothetical protein